MSALIDVHSDVAAVTHGDLLPNEVVRRALEARAGVLGATEEILRDGIERGGMGFGDLDIAIHRRPKTGAGIWIVEFKDSSVAGVQNISVHVENHGPGI